MLLVGKWTHAIGGLVLIGSGMLRLPLPRFTLVKLLTTIPKTAALLSFGYFPGQYYPLMERHCLLGIIGLALLGATASVLALKRTKTARSRP